jgi:alanine racemase
MTRPTHNLCSASALLHNLNRVKRCAPQQKIMAVVKANAYGCGIENIVPFLEGHVDALAVASCEEALAIRRLGVQTDCVLLQGVFCAEELVIAAEKKFQCVIHTRQQLDWLLCQPLPDALRIWVKVDTGMHRLGFQPEDLVDVMDALRNCAWVSKSLGVMSHFANADTIDCAYNVEQLRVFNTLPLSDVPLRSFANSAAILSIPNAYADVVRPGIMLYGVSPFADQTGEELGLKPVMRLISALSAIHHYPAKSPIGYGGIWESDAPSVIGVIPVGYADGYPRCIRPGTPVWVNGSIVPIVGRVSMDILTVDLTHCVNPKIGDPVELWGCHIPIETIARAAGTIAYELLTKVTNRVRVQ